MKESLVSHRAENLTQTLRSGVRDSEEAKQAPFSSHFLNALCFLYAYLPAYCVHLETGLVFLLSVGLPSTCS